MPDEVALRLVMELESCGARSRPASSRHSEVADPCPTARAEEFVGLARQLGAVWNDPETDARLKKRIVRTLIQKVSLDMDGSLGEMILMIHWKGGLHTEQRVLRWLDVKITATHCKGLWRRLPLWRASARMI